MEELGAVSELRARRRLQWWSLPRLALRAQPGPAFRRRERSGSDPRGAAHGEPPAVHLVLLLMVLPGSCCPFEGLVPLSEVGAGSLSDAAAGLSPPPLRPAAPPRRRPRPPGVLPARLLLGLGLLQTGLGCALVALSFRALWLSSAPQVKNACPLWAGSSAVLCGILGLTTWKRPMMLLANLFILLSIICVLLNLAGFILGCQGIQFVSRVPRCHLMGMNENKNCFCCEELHLTQCTEVQVVLKLYHVKSCSAAHLLIKKVLLALCALNALTTTVCLVAAALHYLQIFTSRRSCIDESQIEDQDHSLDPVDFIPPVPPPSYFATFNSCTPQTSHRTLVCDVISLPYIYGTRIKGIEVLCRLDPPPPYETVWSSNSSEQGGAFQINAMEDVDLREVSDRQSSQEVHEPSSGVNFSPSSCMPAGVNRRAFDPLRKRSKSDPMLLHCHSPQGTVLSCETATHNDVKQLHALRLQKSSRGGRPKSLIGYKSYMDTKLCVAWILEQFSSSMSPDIHELVENIKSILKSDEKHMAEAVTSAAFLEQVMAPAQQVMSLRVHVLAFRWHPRLLYLESCGDLTTSTTEEDQLAERRIQGAEHERPHSLISVVRETVF